MPRTKPLYYDPDEWEPVKEGRQEDPLLYDPAEWEPYDTPAPEPTPAPDEGYHPIEGLKVFAEGLTKLPKQMLGKSAAAVQGWRGASVVDQDWWDKQYSKAQKESEEFSAKHGEERVFPGISERDVAELPENLAFSGLAAMAGLGVGVPTAMLPVPGARPCLVTLPGCL